MPDLPGAALQRRDALPRRPLRPVPLPALPGRPHGLRARVRHRLLRRRPRQLHVPPLRPRHVARPRLRRRQAAPDEELPGLEPGRAPRRATWSSSPATRGAPTGSSPWPSSSTSGTSQLPATLMRYSELRGAVTEFQNRGPEQKRVSNGLLFGVENSLKALKGEREALADREFFAKKAAAEADLPEEALRRSEERAGRPPGLRRHPAGGGPPEERPRRAELREGVVGLHDQVLPLRPHARPRRRRAPAPEREPARGVPGGEAPRRHADPPQHRPHRRRVRDLQADLVAHQAARDAGAGPRLHEEGAGPGVPCRGREAAGLRARSSATRPSASSSGRAARPRWTPRRTP